MYTLESTTRVCNAIFENRRDLQYIKSNSFIHHSINIFEIIHTSVISNHCSCCIMRKICRPFIYLLGPSLTIVNFCNN